MSVYDDGYGDFDRVVRFIEMLAVGDIKSEDAALQAELMLVSIGFWKAQRDFAEGEIE